MTVSGGSVMSFRVQSTKGTTCFASCGHFGLSLGYVGSVEFLPLLLTESAECLNIL
jgi:hypothetical protein